jgi:hypothetical protein
MVPGRRKKQNVKRPSTFGAQLKSGTSSDSLTNKIVKAQALDTMVLSPIPPRDANAVLQYMNAVFFDFSSG